MTWSPGALPLLTLRLGVRFDGPAPALPHAAELWRGAVKGALQRQGGDLLERLSHPEKSAQHVQGATMPTNQTTPGYVLRVAACSEGASCPPASVHDQVVHLTFFGAAADHALAVVYALFQEGAGPGIGERRRRYAIPWVQAYAPLQGWQALHLPLHAGGMRQHQWVHADGASPGGTPEAATQVLLRFTSRLVLEVRDAPQLELPALVQLVESLGRRCNRLGRIWGHGEVLSVDEARRQIEAAHAASIEPGTAWQTARRQMTSGRQGSHYPSHGPRGQFLYALTPEAASVVLPLLRLGQWTHVGAHTTAGQGHYQLLVGAA